MLKIYARTTREGTAASETALCEEHTDQAENFPLDLHDALDGFDAWPPLVDCSGNDALECQVCGAVSG